MKIILYGWINFLNFQNEETIHIMGIIHAMHSTISQQYIERERYMHYDVLQSKNILLFWPEISYIDGSNDQSKLLNNLFVSKSCWILNFMIF
jgi:hypothetical protein